MHSYPLHDPVDELEPWPFDEAESGYRIVRGDPRASGRFDLGDRTSHFRAGIWSCTEGAFECTERGDELQTVISGRLVLTDSRGNTIECGPGDSVLTRRGERVTWDILETVTKVFFTHDRDGTDGA